MGTAQPLHAHVYLGLKLAHKIYNYSNCQWSLRGTEPFEIHNFNAKLSVDIAILSQVNCDYYHRPFKIAGNWTLWIGQKYYLNILNANITNGIIQYAWSYCSFNISTLKKGFSHSGVFDKLYQTLSTCITNSIIQLWFNWDSTIQYCWITTCTMLSKKSTWMCKSRSRRTHL